MVKELSDELARRRTQVASLNESIQEFSAQHKVNKKGWR
jgi:hypothetical protein